LGWEEMIANCEEAARSIVQSILGKQRATRDFLHEVLAATNGTNVLKAGRVLMDPYLDPLRIS
jgi:hypothetical protein